MKIDFKDIVKLQKLYLEIFEEKDCDYPDYRVIENKIRAYQEILDKITDDKELQNKIAIVISSESWNTEDNTYKPICNKIRDLGFEIEGVSNVKD